jgi:hypothetical protein
VMSSAPMSRSLIPRFTMAIRKQFAYVKALVGLSALMRA